MKYSRLFTKTLKDVPHDADSANAQFLTRAGFIHQEFAGVYSYLPLGLRTLRNIENIIREEIENIGGQEILMSAMTPKKVWKTTGRWDGFDALFKFEGAGNKEYALGATHEEIVTPLVKDYVFSYKDLPFSVFQIQNKFRNEPRAKSGILRGREFSMKDLYSFHTTQESLDEYYLIAKEAYLKIFNRLGFSSDTIYYTYASGGVFSKYSHEFQIISDIGEDTIYCCEKCRTAINKEILEGQSECPECGNPDLIEKRAIEVGNIFKLGTRFSDPFKFTFTDKDGQSKTPLMGCYGIGPSRIMGTLVEVFNDENGMIWPKSVTPYQVYFVDLLGDEKAEELYDKLSMAGISVCFDDRDERAGAKFKDADLIGFPLRIVLSKRTLETNSVEWKERNQSETKNVALDDLIDEIKKYYTNN